MLQKRGCEEGDTKDGENEMIDVSKDRKRLTPFLKRSIKDEFEDFEEGLLNREIVLDVCCDRENIWKRDEIWL